MDYAEWGSCSMSMLVRELWTNQSPAAHRYGAFRIIGRATVSMRGVMFSRMLCSAATFPAGKGHLPRPLACRRCGAKSGRLCFQITLRSESCRFLFLSTYRGSLAAIPIGMLTSRSMLCMVGAV